MNVPIIFTPSLSHGELLQMKRWNTPTIYNGWEQITKRDAAHECFNLEESHDFMPQMGPMVGYAVTVVVEPGSSEHPKRNPQAWINYYEWVASLPGPKIVVVQDLDKPRGLGAFWGEVTSNTHRSLGCVGTIIDGCIRDVDEMTNAGFKAIARRMCVGHAHNCPVRWGCEVEVFGTKIQPGQLIHADKHGFLAIPFGEEAGLLEVARYMDTNECTTVIDAARSRHGQTLEQYMEGIRASGPAFQANAAARGARVNGEW